MSAFSQFTGGGSPVGSVVMMPDSTSTDQFTTNGQTFLRTGKLATYSAAYSNAVTNGQGYTQWATSVANNSNITPYPHRAVRTDAITAGSSSFTPYMTYALGVWGQMTPITQNSEYGAQTLTLPQTYVFSGGSTGLRNPVILRLPLQQAVQTVVSATVSTYFLPKRSAPVYLSGQNLWAFVEITQSFNTSSSVGNILGFTVYFSKSGSQWRSVFLPSNSGYLINALTIDISAAASANCIFVNTYTQSPAGSIIHQIGVGKGGSSVAMLGYSTFSPDTDGTLYTVSATEVLFEYTTTTPLRVFTALTDNSSLQNLAAGADYAGANNTSFCFTRNDTTMVFFASSGNVVKVGTSLSATLRATAKTVSGATPLAASTSTSLVATWTGSYFVIWTESSTGAGTYQPYYSTDGNSWTAVSNTYSSNSVTPSNEPNATLKAHVFLNSGNVTWNIWSFATNNIISAPNNADGLEQPVKEYVTFNSALYAIQRNSYVSKTDSNLVTSELSTYTTAVTGATFDSGARLKVVNGHMFVVNTTNNILFYTSDGTNWATVSISAITRIIDIEYIGTNWVVVGVGGTNNAAYSANLSTWTGVTIITSGATVVYGVLNVGTALVAFGATGMRRSTDGVTWSAITGSFNATTGLSLFYNSTTSTAYAYQSYSASIGSYRYVSTDAGLTWTGASISSLVGINNTNVSAIPFGFKQFNGKNYCVFGYPNTGTSASVPNGKAVATTTDFLNFTQVPLPLPMGAITSVCSLDSNILMAIGGFEAYTAPGAVQTSLTLPPMATVVEAVGTASFVGTDTEIQQEGGVGYLRIA